MKQISYSDCESIMTETIFRLNGAAQHDHAIDAWFDQRPGPLGVYWPFRAEFDPRPLIDWAVAEARIVALPVVVDKKGPLEYRAWRPGEGLVDGVWNIPVPEKRDVVSPAIVLAPLVGFDAACYRLGYGGGYFDRTLASLPASVVAIGVGYAEAAIRTIHPLAHDIPLDAIVTDQGVRRYPSD